MKSNSKVSKELLPIGSIVECIYDYGSTTTLDLKVLSINYYFGNAKAKSEKSDLEDLQSMLAYRLPKEKRIDCYLPNLSKAFLGYHVPLFKEEEENKINNSDDQQKSKNAIGCSILGLSSCIYQETMIPLFVAKQIEHLCRI
jgi:hypothetical protein